MDVMHIVDRADALGRDRIRDPDGALVGDCLTLDYSTRAPGETDWTPRRESICLKPTPCNYSGERVWFTCFGCQSRRAVLFSAGGVFACRACHDLAYSSTREDAHERSLRRCQAIQKRLGGGGYGVPVWDIPGKPAGMHWETYERLASQLRALATLFGVSMDVIDFETGDNRKAAPPDR